MSYRIQKTQEPGTRVLFEAPAMMATRHLGIISKLCLKWWRHLPSRTRCWYDTDDMTADVVLHVVRVAKSYDRHAARESTWIHRVAENRCKTILKLHRRQMRCESDVVSLTEIVAQRLSAEDSVATRHSLNAVAVVYREGTDAVKGFVDALVRGKLRASEDALTAYVQQEHAFLAEFRETARRADVTVDDFVVAMRCARA